MAFIFLTARDLMTRGLPMSLKRLRLWLWRSRFRPNHPKTCLISLSLLVQVFTEWAIVVLPRLASTFLAGKSSSLYFDFKILFLTCCFTIYRLGIPFSDFTSVSKSTKAEINRCVQIVGNALKITLNWWPAAEKLLKYLYFHSIRWKFPRRCWLRLWLWSFRFRQKLPS